MPAATTPEVELPTVTPTATAENSLGTLLKQAVPTSKAAAATNGQATATIVATRTTTRTNAIAALLPTLTPTPRVTSTRTPGPPLNATVIGAQVNVRGGPGTNYPVVGKAAQGTALQVNGRTESGDWLRVCCPAGKNVESWISAEFLEVDMPN